MMRLSDTSKSKPTNHITFKDMVFNYPITFTSPENYTLTSTPIDSYISPINLNHPIDNPSPIKQNVFHCDRCQTQIAKQLIQKPVGPLYLLCDGCALFIQE